MVTRIFGYGIALSSAVLMIFVFLDFFTGGRFYYHEPNPIIAIAEMGMAITAALIWIAMILKDINTSINDL